MMRRTLHRLSLVPLLLAACSSSEAPPTEDPAPDASADVQPTDDAPAFMPPAELDADTQPPPDVDTAAPDVAPSRDAIACTPTGAESTDATCADGVDNDCDGRVDCDDFDCSRAAAVHVCGSIDAGLSRDAGARRDAALARDALVARDATARRDAGPCTPTGMENTNARCADGVDNDCDGYLDCADFNCSRTATVTVCGRDGGAVDTGVRRDAGARHDAGACTPSGMENTNAACADGVDNDCDGYIDCADFNCSRTVTVTVCRDAGP